MTTEAPLHGPSARTFTLLNINPGKVGTTFLQSILAANHRFVYRQGDDCLDTDPRCEGIVLTHSGPYLDDGRNKCIERAFQVESTSDSEVYVFVDSDVEFNNVDLLNLLAHDFGQYPVVAGSYRNIFQRGWSPVIYTHRSLEDGKEPGGAMDLHPIGDDGWDLLTDTDDPNLKSCHVVGAGFLAISRELLVKLEQEHGYPCPWFAEAISQDRTHLGEDTTFCLRVLELGYPVCVDPRIRLTHTKSIAISGKA